jgi:thioredoxin-dependent peroxiredoxin
MHEVGSPDDGMLDVDAWSTPPTVDQASLPSIVSCKSFAISRGAYGPCGAGEQQDGDADVNDRLEPGDQAPDFSLSDDTGSTVSLGDFAGRKVVVYFYPAAMTPGCTTQACDFSDSLDALQAAGVSVVGISPDKPEKLSKFRANDGLTITLLSDPDRSAMNAYGAFGEKKMYGKTVEGVIRSTFVVDESGRIERAMYNVKATGHVAKLRREMGV